VITAWLTFIALIDSASRYGSFSSTGSGLPVLTAQNLHDRVQISPNIMKVAVPAPQHSPMLGQFPLEQMVWSWFLSTCSFTCMYLSPPGICIRIHAGNRFLPLSLSRSSLLSILRI
jgi:hypothetical protein